MKTANNKIPVSSAKDCKERLSAVALSVGCIIPRLKRFGSRGVSEFSTDALTEIAWEDALQGLGIMSTVAARKCCLSVTCFTNSDISACCFTSVSRARPPENRKY